MRVALSKDRMIEQYFQSCIVTEFEYRKVGEVVEFACHDSRLFEIMAEHVKKLLANSESAKYPTGHPRCFRWRTIIKSRICTFRLDIFPPDKIKATLVE